MCYDGDHGSYVQHLLLREAAAKRTQLELPPSLTDNQEKLRRWETAKRLKRSAGLKQPLEIEWHILENGAWLARVGGILARAIYLHVETKSDIDFRWSVTETKDKTTEVLVYPNFNYGRLWLALQASEMWYEFLVEGYRPKDALQLTLKLTHPWRYQDGKFTSLDNIYEKEVEHSDG